MSAKIAALNDAFRRTGLGGRIVLTAGVSALGVEYSHLALSRVRAFTAFTPDNDPHEEHDFGSFDFLGRKLFWKIDYYDKALKYGSDDPTDPEQTTRVLTLMLAEEY
jgi:hypothetical protein